MFLSYLKSASSNLFCCKVWCKNKNSYIWDPKCLIWVFLGWNLKTILSYLKPEFPKSNVMHSQICLIAKFHEKTKMPKFGTKNALFGYFWVRILKNYCHIWNQHPRIRIITKFGEKMKFPKFETKNALHEYFYARILKNWYHIWNQHHRICLIANFQKKQKYPNLGPKMPYLGTFGLGF